MSGVSIMLIVDGSIPCHGWYGKRYLHLFILHLFMYFRIRRRLKCCWSYTSYTNNSYSYYYLPVFSWTLSWKKEHVSSLIQIEFHSNTMLPIGHVNHFDKNRLRVQCAVHFYSISTLSMHTVLNNIVNK